MDFIFNFPFLFYFYTVEKYFYRVHCSYLMTHHGHIYLTLKSHLLSHLSKSSTGDQNAWQLNRIRGKSAENFLSMNQKVVSDAGHLYKYKIVLIELYVLQVYSIVQLISYLLYNVCTDSCSSLPFSFLFVLHESWYDF